MRWRLPPGRDSRASPASTTLVLKSARSQSQEPFLPVRPTRKLGNLGLANGPRASRRSSSSGMAASSAMRCAISSSRSRSLSLGSWQGVAQTCLIASAAEAKSWCTDGGSGAAAGTRSRTRSQLSSKASASDRSAVSFTPEANSSSRVRSSCGIGQELVAERQPTRVEGHRRADLVEHLDPGRKPCLDRVFGEQALGKRMERADGRAVELLQGLAGAIPRSPSGFASAAFSSSARIRSRQLGSRLLGEGNRRDAPKLDVAAATPAPRPAAPRQRSFQIPHRPRRTASSPGRARSAREPTGRVGVAERRPSAQASGSRSPSASVRSSATGSTRCTKTSRAGSACLRSYCRRSSVTPMLSGSQNAHSTQGVVLAAVG